MLTISLMKKHLIAFNKSVRKQFIISGVSKLKGDEVKQAFKDNLKLVKVGDYHNGEKVTKEFYVPYNTMTDIGYDPKIFKNLIPDKKEPKKREPKKKEPKKTHTMADGSKMSGAVHSNESKVVKSKSGKVFKVKAKK